MAASPPIFYNRLPDLVFGLGDSLLLKCSIVGEPTPQVFWFHNEAIVVEDNRHIIGQTSDGQHFLRIFNANATDGGIYRCVAQNKFGQTSCNARLKIGGKRMFSDKG